MPPFVLLDALEHTLCGAGGTLYGTLAQLARGAGTLAVTALWQGMAVAAVLALALRFLPRLAASQRFALWSAAFAALLGLPLVSLLASALAPGLAAGSASPAAHAWLALDTRWSLGIGALWILAGSWRAAGLLMHSFRLRRMWRAARPVDVSAALEPAISGFPGRRFEVCTISDLDRPSVIGFFRPRILIPDWLFPRLTAGELEQIVLHEYEHLRRRDDWSNLLQKLGLALFPLNPALWFIEARLGEEREMACDEAVVRITRAPRAYAACLASLAERGQQRRAEALSLGAWQRRSELVRRVHSILRGRRGLSPVPSRILAGVIASSVLVVTLELARCPALIAFVPSAPARVVAGTAPLGDAVYPASRRGAREFAPYYALPARAVVEAPAATLPRSRRVDAAPAASAVGELRASSATAPAKPASTSPRARKTAGAHADPADAQPQFVVFTAWEQVDATAGASHGMADYETGGLPSHDAKEGPGNEAMVPAPSPGTQVTVTRLVFRVLPTGSKAARQGGSKSGISLPATIPFGDGWLVLQL